MLPFNDVRHVEYFGRHDLDPVRLHRRHNILRELKILRAQRRKDRQPAAAPYQPDLEAAPAPR